MKVEEQHFETIEAYIEESPGWELDVLQLSPGQLDFSSTLVVLSGVQLAWDHNGAKMEQHTSYQASGIAFGMALKSDSRALFRGHELDFGDALLWQSGEEFEYIVPKGLSSLIVRVDEALVELLGWCVAGSSMQRVPRRHLLKLQLSCHQATLAARELADIPGDSSQQDALLWRDRILTDLEAVLQPWLDETAYLKKGALLATPHFQLIKKTEHLFARYDLEKPLEVDTLARSLGVSPRTLYHAFRESLGVGPYGYFQLIRLHKLRDILLASSPSEANVISLASDLGFNQAGRLSVAYRKHFGESPSETLKRN
ncbi:MAG: helix-turn-helix domain-containing protein [Pseudomonadota bacterium]|nr:helix-turn-helix domain-containing protein [Pseudomonadota bacterium]